MRIKIDGGFISVKKENDKIGFSIGCEHYNPDGTRKETVVNTAYLTEDQLSTLFSDVFTKEDVEVEGEALLEDSH